MTMLSIDCLYRVQRACDCSFLFWHRVVIPIYLQDMFETVTDTHRIHVSSGLQNISWTIEMHSNDSFCTLPLFCCSLVDYFSSPALNLPQGVLLWPVFIRHHPSSENHSLISTKLKRNDSWVVPYQSCSNSFDWLHKMLTGSENRFSKCNVHKSSLPFSVHGGSNAWLCAAHDVRPPPAPAPGSARCSWPGNVLTHQRGTYQKLL